MIALRWPNMPWFFDLVAMSSEIPLCMTQIFSQIQHKNLSNLNHHAWLLQAQLSRSKTSLRQWQDKLRLLKGTQPDQSGTKWAIFRKWFQSNQLGFRAPLIKSIASFLLYLFQDRKLQQNTIDGYRWLQISHRQIRILAHQSQLGQKSHSSRG